GTQGMLACQLAQPRERSTTTAEQPVQLIIAGRIDLVRMDQFEHRIAEQVSAEPPGTQVAVAAQLAIVDRLQPLDQLCLLEQRPNLPSRPNPAHPPHLLRQSQFTIVVVIAAEVREHTRTHALAL